MVSLIKTLPTAIWSFLLIATAISWFLGTDHGFPADSHSLASVLILGVALIKVRLVGYYFMELRDAPELLRALFNLYCVVILAVLIGLYLW